jgi:uncharacterized protein involved in exopolysaccharide biosynthesis
LRLLPRHRRCWVCADRPTFAIVDRMSDNSVDPSGNTEAFRAFTQATPQEQPAASKTPLIVGGALVAVALIVLIVWLALS